jgi:hypothetical protein
MSTTVSVRAVSGLVKARIMQSISAFQERNGATALRGDRHFFSVLVASDAVPCGVRLNMSLNSPIATNVTLYTVGHVPVVMPCYTDADEDYISREPGAFPDILRPACAVYSMKGYLSEVYVEVRIPRTLAPGKYPITLSFTPDGEDIAAATATYTVEVLDAVLPAGETFHFWSMPSKSSSGRTCIIVYKKTADDKAQKVGAMPREVLDSIDFGKDAGSVAAWMERQPSYYWE